MTPPLSRTPPHPKPTTDAGLRMFAVGALVLSLTGCSSVLGGRATSTEEPGIAEIKRRVLELQQQAAVAEVELDRLRREVAELRAAQGLGARRAPDSTARDAAAEWRSSAGGEVIEPAPSAAPPVAAPSVSSTSEIEVSDLEVSRPVGVPPTAGAPLPGSTEPPPPVEMPSAGAASPAPVEVSSEIPPAAQALYDEGYTLYHQGRYLDAEAVFQRFLAAYAALDLTDNALYWIGECRYARGDFEGALASFQETVSRFPAGNKVPAALFKSGRCLESLGDFAGAKRAYEQVASRFPDDPVAGVARQRVAQIQ